jgi:hypothetical protein
MASLAETLRQAGYVTPQGVTGPNAPLARQLKNYVTNVIPTAAQNLAQQRADIDASLTMGDQGIQVGDREAFERQMAQVPNLMGLTAYHGTPHTIKGKFDISKVGTGEGAQAYGHGMYFAENPAVAKEYQKSLSGRTDFNQQPSDSAFIHAVESFRQAGTPLNAIPAEMKKAYKSVTDKDIQLAIQATEKGNLYKVDIPDADIPMMLDYDKPLSQQPKAVQDVAMQYLSGLKNQAKMGGFKSIWDLDGGDLYGVMQRYQLNDIGKLIKKNVDSKDVSDKLLNYGISGIRYLDEGSRNPALQPYYQLIRKSDNAVYTQMVDLKKAKEFVKDAKRKGVEFEISEPIDKRTSNFVVFEPSQVKILEQNSKPMTRKEILEQELKKVVE